MPRRHNMIGSRNVNGFEITITKVRPLQRSIKLADGTLAGTLQGDWSTGYTAYTDSGASLGYWPPTDPDARDTAIEAIVAVATVTNVLGGTVIEVTSPATPWSRLQALQDVA